MDLLLTIACIFAGPLLLLSLFYIPEYFRVAERRRKAREDFQNSIEMKGRVVQKDTEFFDIPSEIGTDLGKRDVFQVVFQVNGKEKKETIDVMEKEKSDWFTRLFERQIKPSYEASSNEFTAYYNRITNEIKSTEEMHAAVHEHSIIYKLIRFYLLFMLFMALAGALGLVYGMIR